MNQIKIKFNTGLDGFVREIERIVTVLLELINELILYYIMLNIINMSDLFKDI